MRPANAKSWVLAALAVVLLITGVWLLLSRRPDPVDMAKYAPESSLFFLEVDSIPSLLDGLTASEAWRELGPALGISSELEYAGRMTELLGAFGLGPEEAVVIGRAELALVVTGVEAATQPAGEGGEAAVVIKPRFALLVETHLPDAAASPVIRERLEQFARRAYGEQVAFDEDTYGGAALTIARAPGGDRQIVWAARDGLVIVANALEPVREVLDTAAGRTASLAANFYLAKVKPEVQAAEANIFAFVSQAGAARLVGIAPGVVAGTLAADPERSTTVARLFGSISERTVQAIGYAGKFEDGRFVDRYFTLLTPELGNTVAEAIQPSSDPSELPALVPPGAYETTVFRLERPGESFEALLTALSSQVDIGVSVAITQIAIELRRQYGVVPEEPVGPALGSEIAFVDFGEDQPTAAVFEIRDQTRLLPVVERYLRADGARISTTTVGGLDVLRSTHEDGRAAAFIGRYLVLATPDQIAAMIAQRERGEESEPLRLLLQAEPEGVVLTVRDDKLAAGELLLAIAGLLRGAGAPPASLDSPTVREALADIPPALSVTMIRDGGILTRTRSSVGSLVYLTYFL